VSPKEGISIMQAIENVAPGNARTVQARLTSTLFCISLVSICVGLGFPQRAFAADSADPTSARAQYEKDRARCESEFSGDERATCLQSAGAALDEAKSGRLDLAQHPYQQNRVDRCTPLPPAERDDCVRRMQGQGSVSGSVQGGGVYRELDTIQVTTPAPNSATDPQVTPVHQ
jgi:hypothetical protein